MKKLLIHNIWKQSNEWLSRNDVNRAAIAYLTETILDLKENDILICDASNESIATRKTSAKVLQQYFKRGVRIYSNERLHAKVLLADRHAIIGSANSSAKAATYSIETAVMTDDTVIVQSLNIFLQDLLINTFTKRFDEKEIKRILKIPLIDRIPLAFTGGTGIQENIEIGNFWIISCWQMRSEKSKAEEEQDEEIKDWISETKNMEERDIDLITCDADDWLCRQMKKDDLVMIIYSLNKRVQVFNFNALLHIDRSERWITLYLDKSLVRPISWTTFTQKIKNRGIRKIHPRSNMPINEKQFRLISDALR